MLISQDPKNYDINRYYLFYIELVATVFAPLKFGMPNARVVIYSI